MNGALKTLAVFIVAACAGSAVAHITVPRVQDLIESGAIHTWGSGDTLTSADLNANFQHIHNLMVGGHGARLVDADVNGSANIAPSKIAGLPPLIAKAWAEVNNCTGGTCTLLASKNVVSVVHTGTGAYTVTLGYTATDITYLIMMSGTRGNNAFCFLSGTPTTTTFTITCKDETGARDTGPSILVMDDN